MSITRRNSRRQGERNMRVNVELAGLCLALLLASSPAAAALGEAVSSVSADQAQMEATLQVTGADKYSVHELQLPSGTTVKEYVSTAGSVFAVSWQGPSLPDLRQVLGKYFDVYTAALKVQGARSRQLESSGLVIQSGGRMRAFFGRVYVPQMLPRGVLAEDIQ
jgi:hypothetical protein